MFPKLRFTLLTGVLASVLVAPRGARATCAAPTCQVLVGPLQIQIGQNGGSFPVPLPYYPLHLTGGAALFDGPTNASGSTPDASLVQVSPSTTTIPAPTTTGVYSTLRLGSVTYSAASGAPNMTEAATLYLDGAATLTGGVSVSHGPYALHVASGLTRVDGGLIATTLAGSAGVPTYVDTNGAFTPGGYGVVALNFNELVSWASNLNGAVPFSQTDGSTLHDAVAEFPINYLAASATLYCNLANNTISGGGSLNLTLTRNGSLVGGSFWTWTNSSATGAYSATLSTGSSSASDVYSLHFQTGGAASTSTAFACRLQFN